MILDKKNIEALSRLAKIEVNDNEVDQYVTDCSTILDFVNQIQSVNTDKISPLNHPLEIQQRLREDAVSEKNQREALESLCDHIESHLYTVPKVIE